MLQSSIDVSILDLCAKTDEIGPSISIADHEFFGMLKYVTESVEIVMDKLRSERMTTLPNDKTRY